MSNIDQSQKPIIPNFTGYPILDTIIRAGLLGGSAALTTAIVVWLNAHGFKDPNLQVLIYGAILSTMITVVTIVWSIIQTKLNQLAVVQHTINAAATGQISDAIKEAAVAAPSIDNETVMKAVNNAETIRKMQ